MINASRPTTETSGGLARRLADCTGKLRASLAVPGITTSVIDAEGSIFESCSGAADSEAGTTVDPSHRLLGASTGKMIVAAVTIQLHLRATLSLDAPLGLWLDREPFWNEIPAREDLTLKLLLQHRSGLGDYVHSQEFAARREIAVASPESAQIEPGDLIALALRSGSLCPPDTCTIYSDANYLLAGIAIERATGRRYYDMAAELVLRPAGMRDTIPSVSPRIERLIPGYQRVPVFPGAPIKNLTASGTLIYNPGAEWTGGGYATTAADLSRLVRFLFRQDGLGQDYLRKALEAHPIYERTPPSWYGLGVVIAPTIKGPTFGHTGRLPGYLSVAGYAPVPDDAFSMMTNYDGLSWNQVHEVREGLLDVCETPP